MLTLVLICYFISTISTIAYDYGLEKDIENYSTSIKLLKKEFDELKQEIEKLK